MLVKRGVGRPAPLLQASKLQQQLAQKLMASDFLNFHLTPVKHTLFFSWIMFADYLKRFFLPDYSISEKKKDFIDLIKITVQWEIIFCDNVFLCFLIYSARYPTYGIATH